MTGAHPQARPDAAASHLVIYDGVCGLCSRSVQFLLAHDRRRVLVFASLQSQAGRAAVERFGGNPDEMRSLYVVADRRTANARMFQQSDAVLFLARQLGWPWKAALVFSVLPVAARDALYNVVARHRYRVLGRHEQCLMPRPEHRDRFVDEAEEIS